MKTRRNEAQRGDILDQHSAPLWVCEAVATCFSRMATDGDDDHDDDGDDDADDDDCVALPDPWSLVPGP